MSRTMMDDRYMYYKEPVENVLESLKKADVVEYTTMAATESSRKYGVTGQSLKQVLPNAVEVDGMGLHFVHTECLVPILVQAIQELTAKVEALEAKRTRSAPKTEQKAEL